MRSILAPAHHDLLCDFAWSNVLLAFDFDGTLAPIVAEPARAALGSRTRRLLREVSALYPVVVISGRSQADAIRRLRGVGVFRVVGNHGIEPWQDGSRHGEQVKKWLPVLAARVGPLPGVVIENKYYSVAIHIRRARRKSAARATIRKAAAALGNVRIIGGKDVVNVLPLGAPHKGMALERERELLHCETAIYVGDDETDEDVFSLGEPGKLLTIRVGRSRYSRAEYYVRDQSRVDELLRLLRDLRSRGEDSSGRGDRA